MKITLNKIIALLLAVLILTAVFIQTPVDAKNSDEDRALTMMYLAHGRINSISDINQLKNMKDDYFDHYDEMLNNPNLDEEQKARLLEIRDGKLDLVDEKIEELREINRRKKRSWSPLGILRGGFKGGKRIVGSTLKAAGNTLIKTIKDPRELALSTLTVVATGGASSIKDVGFKILKTNVTRAGRRAMYAETAKMASKNKAFKKLVELKNFLGIKTNPDADAALEGVNDKDEDEEIEQNNNDPDSDNEPESDDSELGYDGEGGYDDEEDETTVEIPTIDQLNGAVFTISYTNTSFDITITADASEQSVSSYLQNRENEEVSKIGTEVKNAGTMTFTHAGDNTLIITQSEALASQGVMYFMPETVQFEDGKIACSGYTISGESWTTTSNLTAQFYIYDNTIHVEGQLDGINTNSYISDTYFDTSGSCTFTGYYDIPAE